MTVSSLLSDIPYDLSEEVFEVLLNEPTFRLERIISQGHCTPDGEWYDQNTHEWVLVLQGRGRIFFEHSDLEVELGPGDYIRIPAHNRHRVSWTDPDSETIWLALHYGAV